MATRRRQSLTRWFSAIALGLAIAAADGAAGQSTGFNGVLVLRNGNVLTGTVRRAGDDYRIDAAGSTLHLPASQVEMFAPTLEEAYEMRRTDRVGASADSHLALARWCLQLNLLDQAARELLDARMLDPNSPGVALVELQLKQLLDLDAARRTPHRQVDAVTPTVGDGTPANGAPAPAISTSAQVQFVRSIQPMLIRNCATSGCHLPGGAQRLQLDRWALQGQGSPELVRRNLNSVLGELEFDDPPSSALLHWARVTHGRPPHGGGSKAISAHQAALLLEWLNMAAGVAPVAAVPADEATGADASAEGDSVGSASTRTADAADAPGDDPMASTPLIAPAAFTPRDEFDPEIFNRESATQPADEVDSLEDPAQDAMPLDAEGADAGAREPSPPAAP